MIEFRHAYEASATTFHARLLEKNSRKSSRWGLFVDISAAALPVEAVYCWVGRQFCLERGTVVLRFGFTRHLSSCVRTLEGVVDKWDEGGRVEPAA